MTEDNKLAEVEGVILEEIASSTGPNGGWLDSPKAVSAALIERIRTVVSRLLDAAQCHPAACRDEMTWRKVIQEERDAAHADALRAARNVLTDGTASRSEMADAILTITPERARLERELEVARPIWKRWAHLKDQVEFTKWLAEYIEDLEAKLSKL